MANKDNSSLMGNSVYLVMGASGLRVNYKKKKNFQVQDPSVKSVMLLSSV